MCNRSLIVCVLSAVLFLACGKSARADEVVVLSTASGYGCNLTLDPDQVVKLRASSKALDKTRVLKSLDVDERRLRSRLRAYEKQLARKNLSAKSKARYTALRDQSTIAINTVQSLRTQLTKCYSGGFSSSSTPTNASTPVPPQPTPHVAVCGNSIIEEGESCDDGNVRAGDCCAANCRLEAVGTACGGSSGDLCSAKVCNATGACVFSAGDGTLCDDGNACTLIDTCIAGKCEGFEGDAPKTSSSCGVGACARTVTSCVSIAVSCVPGRPSTEVCNGVDDDCNGAVDENTPSVSCGKGKCLNTVPSCVNGKTATCTPLPPSTEICNGLDDDCDGVIDNGNDALCAASANSGAGKCGGTAGCNSTCNPGYADVDKKPENGCEVNLMNDSRNCGQVGNVCPTAAAYNFCAIPLGCSSGQCVARARPAGTMCQNGPRDVCYANNSPYYFPGGMNECDGSGNCGQLQVCPEGKVCKTAFGGCW